jgi:hypothetical protein
MPVFKINPDRRFSFFTFLFISISFIAVKIDQVSTCEPFIRESYALSWDNYGYYLHLPAALIYHDIGIEDRSWIDSLNKKYQPERPFYQTGPGQKNRLVNVYPVGFAVLNLPFFLAGHVSAKIFGYKADGLSPPYQYALIIAALFYAILGMWLLRKLLLRFFNDKMSMLIMILIAYASNLFYYATYDSTLPHITLFAIDTLILLLTIKWHEQQKVRYAIGLGILIGLVTISRPSELVWILVPLFWGVQSWKTFREKLRLLKKNLSQIFLLFLSMAMVGSLQLMYWKYTSGNWFSYNHSEGFDFFRPFTMEVLFSYKKGWLLYTPLMIFAILGIIMMYKKQRPLFFAFTIFFLFNLWVISSWECWWYAGSFGQRPFVQSYGLMAIPLGYFLQGAFAKKITRYLSILLLVFFLLLNQFQIWQLRNGLLHYELETKEFYWAAFGKTTINPEIYSLLEVDRGNLAPLDSAGTGYTHRTIFREDFENSKSLNDLIICDTLGSNSKKSQMLNDVSIYSAGIKMPFDSITSGDYVRVRMYADVFVTPEFLSKPTLITFTMSGHRGQSYCYMTVPIDSNMAKPNTWCRVHGDYVTPHILHRDDKLFVFIWNQGGAKVFLDNLDVEAYEPEKKNAK